MSEEVLTYQGGDPVPKGGKPKFNPKASYEPVSGSKPKFNPNAAHEIVNNTESKIAKSSAPEVVMANDSFSPMSNWLDVSAKGYQPIMQDAVVDNSHFKNTNEAAERINRELDHIDPHIKNLIYDTKKDLQGRIKSQELALNPTEATALNPQAALIESKQRQEPNVSPEEIEGYKSEMGGNVNMVRNALGRQVQDLSKTDPDRANQIKADVYRLDRQEYPAKEEKISKNVQKLKEGVLDYDVKKGILVKPEGFFGSLATGFKQKNQLFKDYEFYKNTDNDNEIIRKLNAKIDDVDQDEAISVPDGGLAEAGAMLGGQPIKPVVGGLIAGAFTSPAGGAVGGGAIGSHEMYKLGYAAALPQNYAAIKRENPDMDDDQVYAKAKDLTEKQAMTDAISGGAMSLITMRMGLRPTGVTNAFKQSLRSGLRQLSKAGVEKGVEGLIGGEAAAIGQQVKNLMAQKAGLPVDIDEGAAEQLVAGVGMTMGMALLMKFPKFLKPSTYNRLTHEIAKMPDEAIAQEVQQLQESGFATPEEAQSVNNVIKEQRDINNSIRGDVPESDRVKIQEKIKKVSTLEKELEESHKAYHPEIKEEIKKLNEEIVSISKGGERGDLQKIVANSDIEGATADVLKNASEKELKGYFKEIAEQANDPKTKQLTIETFGKDIVNKAQELFPNNEKGELQKLMQEEYKGTDENLKNSSEESLKSFFEVIAEMAHDPERADSITFSKKIIDKAKELYPKETPKGSKISVIQPGEIKQPEIITIKPKGNAISEQVTNEMDVHEQASNGEGNVQPEIIAEKEIPASEGTPESQKEIGDPREIGITHRQMDAMAEEFGLPTYEKSPERVAEWDQQAAKKIHEPGALDSLFDKLRKGDTPDHVETRMMLQYMADIAAKIDKDPYNRVLQDQLIRTKDLFNVAGRIQGKGLAARKGSRPIEETLGDFIIRDREANKAPLTDEQVTKSKQEYDDIKAAKDAVDAKVAKLEAENAKLKAQKEIDKKGKAPKSGEKRNFKAERDQILKDMKKKWDDSKGQFSSTFVPYAEQLVKIAPDVAKLVKNLVEEGIDKLPDVVEAVHKQLKNLIPEITERDVHDMIAGEYNKPKTTKNELSEKLYNLRTEASLINRLERLEAGEEPKNEKQKVKRNREIEELRNQIQEHDLTKLAARKSRIQREISKVQEQLKTGQFSEQKKPDIKLDQEAIDLNDKLIKLKQEREKRIAQLEYENRTKMQKLKDVATNILNVPRTLMASADFSAPLRQGIVATIAHPTKALNFKIENGKLKTGGALPEMFRQAFSQKGFDRWLVELKESPEYKLMEDSGLYIADPNDLRLQVQEEQFMSNLGEKIPVIGRIVKGSERGYVAYLNKMRADLFKQGAEAFADQGRTFENSPELYKGLATFINNATGRGGLGPLERSAQVLNTAFFSPRLIASRLNMLNPIFYTKLPKEVRWMALKDMGKLILFGASILGLARAAGAQVETDPRSSDFGKIRVGNTRWDIWGGFQQYARIFAQLLSGETKSSNTGEIYELKGDKFPYKTRLDQLGSFFRGKLAPVPGTAVDLLAGKNVVGEEFDPAKKAYELFVPMIAQDIAEAWKEQGPKSILTVGVPSALGVGTTTYEQKPSKSKSKPGLHKAGASKNKKTSK